MTQTEVATPTTSWSGSVGLTPRLVLPSAGVDQLIVPGGLSERGTISPPRDTVMWFDGNDRVAPGEVGTSLIAAHVTYGDDDDVFARLDQVEVGDDFTLVGPDDATQRWRVSVVDVLDKGELQRDERVWGPQQEVARLALVTCDSALGFRDDGHRVANRLVLAEPLG